MDWTTLANSDLPNLDRGRAGDFSLHQNRYFAANAASGGTSLVTPTTGAALATAPPRPIEPLLELMQRREAEIHQSIVDRANSSIARKIREYREEGEQKQWEEDQDHWLRAMSAPTTPMLQQQQQQNQQIGYHTKRNQLFLPAPPTQRSRQAEALILEHHAIVRDQAPVSTSATELMRFFRNSASSQPALRPYVVAWDLVAKLILHNTRSSSPGDQCRTLLHFCAEEFREQLLQRTGSRTNAQQLPLVEHCRWYQQQTSSSRTATTTMNNRAWPTIYFLLRCGDATAAAQVGCNDPVAQRVLESLARVQGAAGNIWECNLASWQPSPEHRQPLVEATGALVSSPAPDVYQLGVYKLLGMQTPIHSPVTEGFKEMKDYVYSALWTAYLGNATDSTRLADSVRAIAQQVLKEKPQGGSAGDPWDYALSLMATQHYGSALQWLAQQQPHEGSYQFQAVHVALVLAHAGIPVTDLGGRNDQLLPLLQDYASRLTDVVTAAAYLRHIPNESIAATAIGALIAHGTSEDFLERTVGHLDDNGNRLGGELNAVLSPNLISKSLVEAASFIAADEPTERDRKALQITCLTQAGKFPEAIRLMNRFISPPDIPDDQREYFLDVVGAFQHKFLRPGNKIRSFLETQQLHSLMDANHLLVDLNRFFALCRSGDAGCSERLYQLQLLPLQPTDIPTAEEKYRQSDPTTVQPVYPSLVVAAMELLAREYQDAKRNNDVAKTLEQRARAYMTFVDTVLDVPHDVAAKLSLLRARIF